MSIDENNKITNDEIRKIDFDKGDGRPYLEWLDEEYEKISEEEKKKLKS